MLVKETFQDSELQSDIEYLQGFLTDRVNDMRWGGEGRGGERRPLSGLFNICYLLLVCSSFDEYAAEVRSGRLEWSPVHRSNKFWVREEWGE